MLRVYWDESGHSKDPACQYLGMGGVVAPAAGWDRFEKSWAAALVEFGAPFFHASALEHNEKPYRDKATWTPSRKLAFTARMASCIAEAGPTVVGATLHMSAWRALSEADQAPLVDPWFCCLQECVRLSVVCAVVEHETIATVFSQQEEFRDKALLLWNQITQRKDGGYERLGAFVMDDMRTLLPLQAADFVVYEMVKNAKSLLGGGVIRPAIPMLIAADPGLFIANIDAGYLGWQVEGNKYLALAEAKLAAEGKERN